MMINDNDTEMNTEVRRDRETHTLLAFFCGALAGVTLGILIAPARGRDTRERIARTTREGREHASRLIDGSQQSIVRQKERVATFADGARMHAGEIKAGVVSAVESAGAAIERARKDIVGG